MTASILQQLLALYLAIMYSWQLLSSEKSLVGQKIHYIFQGFYRFRFLLHRYFFSFSTTNACLPCRLRKAYTVLWTANSFVVSENPKHNAFDLFWKNLNSNSNIFQETHDFLVWTDTLIIWIYSRTTDRTFSWPGERPSSHLKVTKMWLGANIK